MTVKFIVLIAIIVVSNLVIAFLKNQTKFRTSLHGKYLLQIIRLIIFVICLAEMLEAIDPELNMRSILLRGSALVVAVLGFAAQPVISAVMSGLLISIHKPFEIGDRVIIDGAATGVVEDITLRHTVISIYDGFRVIIPNSELNSRVVTNTSYRMKDRRGIHLSYSVSYETDVQKAMDVIRDCVAASPYTLSVENRKGKAKLRVEISGEPVSVTITFEDRGIPYDPVAREDPDITLPASQRAIGGLGIFMTKQIMDDVAYEYRDGQNILTLKKRL